MKNLNKTSVNSLFDSIPKIISLIALLLILLFSISCKSEPLNPTEETYNSLIPKEYSGKYIYNASGNYNYNDYFETTSSNCIIHRYISGDIVIMPIVLKENAIYYDGDFPKVFSFFTTEESKRQLNFIHLNSSTINGKIPVDVYIHADDIKTSVEDNNTSKDDYKTSIPTWEKNKKFNIAQ